MSQQSNLTETFKAIGADIKELKASGGVPQVYAQDTPPTPTGGVYIWVQTGLGTDGTDMTFWIEDGL